MDLKLSKIAARLAWLFTIVFMLFIFQACGGKSDGFAPDVVVPTGISISPNAITLAVNNTTTFTASGGTGPYSYSIFSGSGSILSTTGAFTAPGSAGTTVVRVVDGLGQFADAIVTTNAALTISPTSQSLGLNSSQTFTASGGVPPILYSLASGLGSVNSSTGAYTSGSSAGSAVVRATDSIGNTADANVSIFGSLGITPAVIEIAVNNTVNFSAAGGIGPYSYIVLSGLGTVNASTGVYTASSSAGAATVRVTDSLGATSDAAITVDPALAISPSTLQILSVNDTITYTAIDGVPPYTFSIISGTGTIDSSTGAYTAPAISGSATIQLADSYGNTVTAPITITSPLSLSPSAKSMAVNNTFSFTGVGGTTPYTYSIQSGGGSIDSSGLYTAPAAAGSAVVKVTDNLGATATANITINAALAIAPSAPTTSSITGSIFFSASGGVAPYVFSVSSGSGTIDSSSGSYTAPVGAGTDIVTVTDSFGNAVSTTVTVVTGLGINPAGVTIVASSTYTFAGINGATPYTYSVLSGGGSINASTGLYTAPGTSGTAVIRVTDSTSATATANVTITPVLQISPTTKTLAVNNSFTFTSSGGLTPYTYSIFSGLGSVNASSGAFAAGATSGTTVVRVTDANSNTSNATVTVNAALAISPSTATITTVDTRTFSASGGVSPYTYSVYNGDGSINSATGVYTPGTVGSKTIRVTDSLGNISDATLTVNSVLAITPSSANVQTDSDTTFSFTGGVPPVTYSQVTGSGSMDSTTGVYTAQSTTGSASVRVTDALGHTSTASVTVYNPLSLSPVSVTLAINGTQTFVGSGGLGALTYGMFSGLGTIDSSTGAYTASGTAGTDVVKVTDSIGNVATATVTVVSSITITPQNLKLPVFSTATFSTVLGTSPYTYSVTSGSGSINSSTGVYTAASTASSGVVLVTDSATNTSSSNVTHIEPTTIVSGSYHTCALYNEGSVKCWGYNLYGQLGQGSTTNLGDNANEGGGYLPIVNLGTGRTATAIVAGLHHTCAKLDNGQVKCWGRNNGGQLGRGNTASIGDGPGEMGDSLQAINFGAGRSASQIFAFGYMTCSILDDASTKCWGQNTYGQLGLGNTNSRGDAANEMGDSLAAINFGTGRTATMLTGGLDFMCARLDNSTVKCFGRTTYGQVGYESTTNNIGDAVSETGDSLAAVNLGTGRTVKFLASGYTHSCAILDNDAIKCWGRNNRGQMGNGSIAGANAALGDAVGEMGDTLPTVPLTSFTATSLRIGREGGCALNASNQTRCWGYNAYGQLMIGNTSNQGDAAGEVAALGNINFGTSLSVSNLSLGWFGGCGIFTNKRIKCWGRALNGYLLNASTTVNLGDAGGELGDGLPYVNH